MTRNGSRRKSFGAAEIALASLTVGLAVVALAGTGLPRPTMAVAAPLAWVPDSESGELELIDPHTGRIEARLLVAQAGDLLEVAQHVGQVAVTNHSTGEIVMLDSGTWEATGRRIDPSSGVRILLSDSGTYIVELKRGTIRRVDPSTVDDVSAPLEMGQPIIDAMIDADGAPSLLMSGGTIESLVWRSNRYTRATIVGPVVFADTGRSTVVIASGDRVAEVSVGELGCSEPWRPAMVAGLIYVSCQGASRVLVLTVDGQPAGPAIQLPGSPQPTRYRGGLLLTAGQQAVVVQATDGMARQLRITDGVS